jgi:hypothetical protein
LRIQSSNLKKYIYHQTCMINLLFLASKYAVITKIN